jgi:hypothetical protein
MAENYMVRQGMIQPLTAYHGTPHTIQGQFDINKVGTGEGAQAYGYGMYFAENPAVAKEYQKALSGRTDLGQQPSDPAFIHAVESFREAGTPLSVIPAEMKKAYKSATDKDIQLAIQATEKGNLYKVDIPDADIPNMLDWDKPFKQQTQQVQDLLKPFMDENKLSANAKGVDIYQTLLNVQGKKPSALARGDDFYAGLQKDVSEQLNQLGVKGIRYLDEGSRKEGKGTSNFVVFEPSQVKILEQNNKPVTQSSLQSIVDPIRDRGLTIDAYESKKSPLITLSRIEVPKDLRSTGMGTQALQELAQYADQSKKTIALSPSKDFGATSVDRLKDFYKRFGFVENKGKNKDFSISESMYRLPTQPTRKEILQEQIDKIE